MRLRAPIAAFAILLTLASATPALAATTAEAGVTPSVCSRTEAADAITTNELTLTGNADRTTAAGELPLKRGPDPIQLEPGAGLYGEHWPIVSQSSYTYTDGEITHTVTTTVRRGVRPEMRVGTSTGGGHMPALLAGICTYIGTNNILRTDVGCNGWCEYQNLRKIADVYTQNGSNNYYDRIETRNWWTRTIDIPYLGTAHTQWNEDVAIDCNNANQGRRVYSDWTPQWYTWDRTYDYYWDETWLPTVTPGSGGSWLFTYTDTPLLYNGGQTLKTLHTEIGLQ